MATNLQQRHHSDPFDPDGPVWFASEADDRVRRKLASTRWGGLVSAGLQHPVSPSMNIVGRHSLQGLSRSIAPSDR